MFEKFEGALMKIKIGLMITAIVGVLLSVFVVLNSVTVIKSGTVGVESRMGAVQDQVMQPGLHFKAPFITSVAKMNTQTQKVEVESSAASKDLQTITSTVAVNYHVDPHSASALYKNVGVAYEHTIISPAIQESVKAAMSQFSAEQLITRRQEVSSEIKANLTEKVSAYGIVVDEFNITNLDFSAEFNAAIEAKQTAEQNALKAEQELTKVTIEAKQQIAQAEAEADAIRARAEAEAFAIQVIQEKLMQAPEYLEYQKIQKWDGELPMVQGNSSAIIDFRGAGTYAE